ncbi:MAG: hypothetical protein O3C49_04140, partial [Proteobacteria bacterium]|nr:hypothetical protein [Pseudomonadota bacterium]
MHNTQFVQLARDQIPRDRHWQKYEPKHEGKDRNAEDDQDAVPRTAFTHIYGGRVLLPGSSVSVIVRKSEFLFCGSVK